MSGTRVLFVDRDGVLLEEPADEQVDAYEKFRLVRDCVPALRRLREAGFELVMVSNQDGLGTESFPQASFEGPQNLLLQVLGSQGIDFREVLIDPHRPEDAHPNRKPGVGMVLHYLRDRGIDLRASAMVGDRDTDMEFARALGVRGFRFGSDWDWPGIARALLDAPRVARVERRTRESAVSVDVDLDASGSAVVSTGLGFFDHMLEQLG
jgi:imidazoleglycerol-phosphate dehydratase/histidinol-phosphatase